MTGYSPDQAQKVANYSGWRFVMWLKGYGSYRDIDAAVTAGELQPGRDYPDKHKETES